MQGDFHKIPTETRTETESHRILRGIGHLNGSLGRKFERVGHCKQQQKKMKKSKEGKIPTF